MYRSMLLKSRGEQILHVIGILIATISTYTAGATAVQTPSQSVNYLSEYGYLPESTRYSLSDNSIDSRAWEEAIKNFQSFNGLEITGQLDDETKELMSMPRCGVPDKDDSDSDSRSKRYVLQGSRWDVESLTYKISKFSKKLNRADVRADIARAFAVWSAYTDLKFTAKQSGTVDIDIRFEEYEHGNCRRIFDGPGRKLAHAFFPAYGGDAHFDDGEYWKTGSKRGLNLFQVAVHEFGHSLGLKHSPVPSSIMAPIYRFRPSFKLHSDDILAIQALYPRSGNELCEDPKIDAMFSQYGKYYVFKGDKYYEVTKNGVADGYPKYISDGWPGLPSDIDAAFSGRNGKTYFFKGTKYWRYVGRVMDQNFPKQISKRFPGIPDNIDAAITKGRSYYIYFFKGKRFWRFGFGKEPPVKPAYPKPISKWKGLPNNLDAAQSLGDGYIYFFKGDKFYRFKNRPSFAVGRAVASNPKSSADYFFGCDDVNSFGDVQADDDEEEEEEEEEEDDDSYLDV